MTARKRAEPKRGGVVALPTLLSPRLSPQHRVLAVLVFFLALATPADPSLTPTDTQFCSGVRASSVLAARSIALGGGLSVATAGVPAAFTILARESNGAAAVNSDATFHVDFAGDSAAAGGVGTSFQALAFQQPCPTATGGCVAAVEIVSRGSGCLSDGELTASGGGGAGFLAEFTQSGGTIAQVHIVNAGEGYTSPPALAISDGGVGCASFSLAATVNAGNEYEVVPRAPPASSSLFGQGLTHIRGELPLARAPPFPFGRRPPGLHQVSGLGLRSPR
jgi:hypothetical protein